MVKHIDHTIHANRLCTAWAVTPRAPPRSATTGHPLSGPDRPGPAAPRPPAPAGAPPPSTPIPVPPLTRLPTRPARHASTRNDHLKRKSPTEIPGERRTLRGLEPQQRCLCTIRAATRAPCMWPRPANLPSRLQRRHGQRRTVWPHGTGRTGRRWRRLSGGHRLARPRLYDFDGPCRGGRCCWPDPAAPRQLTPAPCFGHGFSVGDIDAEELARPQSSKTPRTTPVVLATRYSQPPARRRTRAVAMSRGPHAAKQGHLSAVHGQPKGGSGTLAATVGTDPQHWHVDLAAERWQGRHGPPPASGATDTGCWVKAGSQKGRC